MLLEKLGKQVDRYTGTQVDRYTGKQVEIIEPCAIDPTAEISNSKIGPYASIGANCKIENSTIAESIVEAGCEIKDAALNRSLIGKQAKVHARGDGKVMKLNVGDSSEVLL